jgi:hypothetical protein
MCAKGSDAMNPDVFEQMVKLTVGQMEAVDGRLPRAQHAKATGCVTAEFRIADTVPAELRHGVFREPGRVFNAIVRFSNSQSTIEKDSEKTARGLAIKLLDVTGPRAVPDDGDGTQDFLMIDHPVFPFPDPKAYVETISRKSIPLVGKGLAFAHLALLEHKELKIITQIKSKTVASPLGINYWSGTPFWLGPATGPGGHAIKYSAVARQANRSVAPTDSADPPDDALTRALDAALQSAEAVFDFKVQRQTDPVAMPVEDVSVEWHEEAGTDRRKHSVPEIVATLVIPRQRVDPSSELAARCEAMSFNPWHSLAEHRPLGGMNRLRKVVYLASVQKRGGGAASVAAV